MSGSTAGAPRYARIWRGRTSREHTDEYEASNYDTGSGRCST